MPCCYLGNQNRHSQNSHCAVQEEATEAMEGQEEVQYMCRAGRLLGGWQCSGSGKYRDTAGCQSSRWSVDVVKACGSWYVSVAVWCVLQPHRLLLSSRRGTLPAPNIM